MDLQLKGHKALITGGTKGIGRAIANTLAEEGCDIAICSRTAADVTKAVEEISALGVKATGAAVDIMDGAALKAWIAKAADELGGLDILVSNGSGGNAPGEEGWRANFEGDVMGMVRSVEAAMPFLEASSNGNIIAISSTAALEQFLQSGPYNAMKAAVIQYAGALAYDLAPKGIRVNSISPGPIMIEGGAWDMIKQHMTPLYEQTVANVALGRLGSADEVAAHVALLVSPRASFTTATNTVIDGGFTKRIEF